MSRLSSVALTVLAIVLLVNLAQGGPARVRRLLRAKFLGQPS